MASFILVTNALIERNGKYLMVEEGKEHVKGQWNIPGGGIELTESPKEAIRREVKEETGLEVTELNGLITVLNGNSSKDGRPVLILLISAEVEEGEPKPEFDQEILGAEFKTRNEIDELDLRNDIFYRALEHNKTQNLPMESLDVYKH